MCKHIETYKNIKKKNIENDKLKYESKRFDKLCIRNAITGFSKKNNLCILNIDKLFITEWLMNIIKKYYKIYDLRNDFTKNDKEQVM